LTKPELLAISKKSPLKTKYVIEKLAEECGKDVKVLWLPPAHCEFNAIELIWAFVKKYVAAKNKGNTIKGIYDLSLEALSKVTPELWINCINHAKKYEDQMWERDRLVDENLANLRQINPVNIILNDDDTDSDSETEEESESEEP